MSVFTSIDDLDVRDVLVDWLVFKCMPLNGKASVNGSMDNV